MVERSITADYAIMGAGAVGMAFADSVLSESDATIAIVDRRGGPGGHWNDAYPFVRLHQPSSFYGVGSTELGSGRIDDVGANAGYYELASGQEVLSHFDRAMHQRFLPSGRVRYFPMSELGEDRIVTSLLSGERCRVDATRFVDATYSKMQIPSVTPPSYAVAPEVTCVPPNHLAKVAPDHDRFVVVGAGKTGMDTCVWLLANGAEPDQITWIVSRDSWVLDRANTQPGPEFFAAFCKSLADQVESVALADSVEDVLARLEACGELARLDPSVTPGAYHCATLSRGEMDQLRRITDVVRLGRVVSIEAGEVDLEQGSIPGDVDALYIDCSAAGIPTHPSTPIFDGDRITVQWVRTCQPTFSAGFVGFIESTFDDEAVKNRICTPIVPPTVPADWLRMLQVELGNRQRWMEHPSIDDWMARTRLDPFTKVARARMGVDREAAAHLGRYLENIEPAVTKLEQFVPTESLG